MGRDSLGLARDSLFIEKAKKNLSAPDADFLIRAYAFSKERGSASFEVGHLLIDQGADAVTVAAALLAPLLWHGLASAQEIGRHFGSAVMAALENLDSPSVLQADNNGHHRQDIRAILSSLSGGARNAVLLISFRLAQLEHVDDRNEADARRMAREALDLYVPVADRLSLGDMRRRLEDTSFRILQPAQYAQLREEVAPIQAEDDKCLDILLAGVQRLLDNMGICHRLQGRTKSLYAIRRKMDRTGKTLRQIMDRVGLRVIVTNVPECYTVLGLLHTHFNPIPGTFDDYIGLPKDNGYQSLHTCVYPVRETYHKPIEFQVRTELMHAEAEYGDAAHWRYKSEAESGKQEPDRAKWIEGLVRQHDAAESPETFIELLHRQVFTDHLVVFGNGGRIVRLGDGATVRDYLRRCNIRLSAEGSVRVNGRSAAIDHHLQDGDSVEVVENGETPRALTAGSVPGYRPDRSGSREN